MVHIFSKNTTKLFATNWHAKAKRETWNRPMEENVIVIVGAGQKRNDRCGMIAYHQLPECKKFWSACKREKAADTGVNE